jgi:chromosome segregation ATPase
MNQAEFDELRRKLRAKTSSCRYRKRKKVCSLEKVKGGGSLLLLTRRFVRQEETRKKKKKIQELKAELARLQDIERQSKHYEQRSLEDLEEELAKHKQEVADLSVKIGEAAQEELDWVSLL